MDQEKQLNVAHVDSEKDEPCARHEEENTVLDRHHAEYLLRRHGTTDLDPLPSADPLDPLNWPTWRKNVYLVIFSFHGMMAGFLAAGLVPAFAMMAEAYGKSLAAVAYLVSAQVSVDSNIRQ